MTDHHHNLTFVSDVSESNATLRSTNLTQSLSERSTRNPITNTVLRNLVLARVPARIPQCRITLSSSLSLPDLVLEYGFPQRDWQSRLLQEAIEPKQLRVVVNPSNITTNGPTDVNDLPMNASLAADLLLHSLLLAPTYFRWSPLADFANMTDIMNRYPQGENSDSAARMFNLTPPTALALGEAARREWFLRESAAAWIRKLNHTHYTARSDVVMEFSHVDILPTMRFDALTVEVETDRMHVADTWSKDNSTRFNTLESYFQCGPWPMRCLMRNPGLPGLANDTRYDPPSQVQVFGVCMSPNGTEELSFREASTDMFTLLTGLRCNGTSNTSLMVMSIGKRFTAQGIIQNKTANAFGYVDDSSLAVATNLRRIHTFTIAKLSWEPQNLTAEFHAECADDAGSCEGLRFPLAPTNATESQHQDLIVGVDALPMNLLTPLMYNHVQRFLPLIQLHEPSRKYTAEDVEQATFAADPLLPHNVQNITWDMPHPPLDWTACTAPVEDRLQLIFNNHMYIEHGLQTAYTAATFFLLQNAVVKDVIRLDNDAQTLNFQHSTHRIALVASIPSQNAWFTLGGCALLVLGLCSVLVWAWITSDGKTGNSDRCRGLGDVTTPHVVARVMLDSVHFPPLFLHRRVIDATDTEDVGENKSAPSVEDFVISELALQKPPKEENKEETPCAHSA